MLLQTAWFEQIHIADVTERFVNTYIENDKLSQFTQDLAEGRR